MPAKRSAERVSSRRCDAVDARHWIPADALRARGNDASRITGESRGEAVWRATARPRRVAAVSLRNVGAPGTRSPRMSAQTERELGANAWLGVFRGSPTSAPSAASRLQRTAPVSDPTGLGYTGSRFAPGPRCGLRSALSRRLAMAPLGGPKCRQYAAGEDRGDWRDPG